MRELVSQDTISGKKGRAYAKINGNNEELFFAKTIEATVELLKSEIKAVGKFMTGHKVTGANGTGSMTLFYLSPIFRTMVAECIKNRRSMYFDLVVENDDEESAAGKQVILLSGVCFDSVVLAKLDGDSDDSLEEDVDFTFESFEILTPFTKF